MSNAVLPVLPGCAWDRPRTAKWSTTTKESVSGREYRGANWSYPRYEYAIDYEVLRQRVGEYEQMLGFVNARQGSFDTFLHRDRWDNEVALQHFNTGDGVSTQFRLVRTFGGVVEPVFGIVEAPQIFASGVLVSSGVSTSADGLVTFAVAPANGVPLSWTGGFYWRCRFLSDGVEFTETLHGLHQLKGLSFITVKG